MILSEYDLIQIDIEIASIERKILLTDNTYLRDMLISRLEEIESIVNKSMGNILKQKVVKLY